MFLLAYTATYGATPSGRNMRPEDPAIDPHVDGAMEAVQTFAHANASRPEMFEMDGWHKNKDKTYSKVFKLVLKNGAECSIISKKTINEKEYFKRKLKYG